MSPAAVETMAFSGELPWHGLGVDIGDSEIDSETMIVKAGLDWTVQTVPVFAKTEGEVSVEIPVPEARAIIRTSDYSVLGVTGNRFTPVQNRSAFNFFDTIVGGKKACYHTAGSLMGGKRVWMLAKLPDKIVVGKEDISEKYLLLSNAHDGKHALEMLFTSIRCVCWNTVSAALNEGRNNGKPYISMTHTNNVQLRMKQAEESFKAAEAFYARFNEHANLMAHYQYNSLNLKQLIETLFPADSNNEVSKATQEKRDKILYLYDHGRGQDISDVRHTAWAAFNSCSEYADHYMNYRGDNKADRRLNSIWFGAAATLKQQAMNIITSQMNA